MKKIARVKVLLLLMILLVLAYGGMRAPAYAQTTCPTNASYYCVDVRELCNPGPGCGFIHFTYIGICNGVKTYAVSCAACPFPGMDYCVKE